MAHLQELWLIVPDGVASLIIVLDILGLGVQPGLVALGFHIPYPLGHCGHQTDSQAQ